MAPPTLENASQGVDPQHLDSAAIRPPAGSELESEHEFNKEIVAGLTDECISGMTTGELVEAIETVALPSHSSSNLHMKDRDTLRRLVYLARRTCRNQGY